MARMGRPGLSDAQKAELWHRWKDGQSLSDIGRALSKHAGSIHGVVSLNGGIVPAVRRRSHLALTLAEREEISRGLAAQISIRQMAAEIGRAPSTVSREITRHGGLSRYRASAADAKAWDRAQRPKPCRLATQHQLRDVVAAKLALDWSPQQIAGWLEQQFPKGRDYAGVSRNDLPQPIHPSPWRAQERARRTLALTAHDATLQEGQHRRAATRPDH